MSTCSRCGATDNRHSVECLQAMALGVAMGVETLPTARATGAVSDDRLEVRLLRSQVGELRTDVERWRRRYDDLARRYDALLPSGSPVTQLPPGYYDEKHVSPERLAEIEREVAELNESPLLDVVVHDPVNATATPVDAATIADDLVGPVPDKVEIIETPPAPEPEAVVRPAPEAAPRRRGAAAPDYVHPDAAAFIADALEKSDNPADFVLTARISSTLTAWNTRNGKNLAPTPAFREIAKQFMRGRPALDGKQVDAYYGMRIGGKADGTAAFVPERARTSGTADKEERRGVAGAWKSPETEYIEELVGQFLDANLVVTQDPQDWLANPDLRAAYDAWAQANGKPDSNGYPGAGVLLSRAIEKRATGRQQRAYSGPVSDAGAKPIHYRGVRLGTVPAEAPKPGPPPGSTEHIRALMAKARDVKVETIPEPGVDVGHSPDELAMKLAQLKHFGIGGQHGVSRPAAEAAVADLHPTGREVWKVATPTTPGGQVADAQLDATAYQLLVKCMNGLPEEIEYDTAADVMATSGYSAEAVEAALRNPQRVEIRPESWEATKRYAVLGFHRGDVQVILGMRDPSSPKVIAAYWTSLLQADKHRVNYSGGGGAKKEAGLPSTPTKVISQLRQAGCEIPDPVDEKPVEVTYKGQSLGKIMTARSTTKITAQTDYQRTLRKKQAIDRREEAKVG